MGTARSTVALCDDHPLFRLGLAMALEAGGLSVVGEYGDVTRAVEGVRRSRPDVLLLDLLLPDGHGFDVLEALGDERPGIVVVVTTVATPALWRRALDLGCQAILEKDLAPADLVDVVRALLEDPEDRRWRPEVHLPVLTDREHDVLVGLTEGRSNREIARVLGIGVETVKDRVADVFAKLEVRDRTAAVVRAQELGLTSIPPLGGTGNRRRPL